MQKVFVAGAGFMGAGIAQVAAQVGYQIRLVGRLARILHARQGSYGLAKACVGGSKGIATIIERETGGDKNGTIE